MTGEERKTAIAIALEMLRAVLIDTYSSVAIYEEKLIFFSTDEYMEKGNLDDTEKFAVSIHDLVK